MKITTQNIWNGSDIILETGEIAKQTDASVLVRIGGTTVLCMVVASDENDENLNYLNLNVNYQEMFYAVGKIPGGFNKREGRSSELEILISRLIDRPIRPLFPKYYYKNIQLTCILLSYDEVNSPEIAATIGSSAALILSGEPFSEAVASVYITEKNGNFEISKNSKSVNDTSMFVSGTKDSIMMVELKSQNISENKLIDSIEVAHKNIKSLIGIIDEFCTKVKNNKEVKEINFKDLDDRRKKHQTLLSKIRESVFTKKIEECFKIKEKKERKECMKKIDKEIIDKFLLEEGQQYTVNLIIDAIDEFKSDFMREQIIKSQIRIDGRKPDEIRQISGQVSYLPLTHGSGLFTRGETQVLSVITIGGKQDEQMVDDIYGSQYDSRIIHYNFKKFCVGEINTSSNVGRREIGHGKLVSKALCNIIPSKEKFPYTVRVVCDVLESNGSSSMASVCAGSLALMDAGIPLKEHTAGIAMGAVITEKDKAIILSDINGDEDHFGDVDLKVTGLAGGRLTALHMDIKVKGLSMEIIKNMLQKATKGIDHILNIMNSIISEPNLNVNSKAPKIISITIDKDKIKYVIGQGGQTIKSICEQTTAKIDIQNDGTVNIFGSNEKIANDAMDMILKIIEVPKIGKLYDGTVVKIMDFGMFVRFLHDTDGLVHISEMAQDMRNIKIDSVFNEGDKIKIKVINIDKAANRIALSMKI